MPKLSKVVNVTSEYREQIRSLQTEIEQLQKTIKEKDSIIKRTLIKLEDATNENNEQGSKDTTN